MIKSDIERQTLVNSLAMLSPNEQVFKETVGKVVSKAINYVLDGEYHFDDLEACEKTQLGIKVEKYFLREFNLPRKTKRTPNVSSLDTVIGGIDVDIKCSIKNSWMIPPEAIGKWCMLFTVDNDAKKYDLGLLKMEPENVTNGKNRDQKRSVSKTGRDNIFWIAKGHSIEP